MPPPPKVLITGLNGYIAAHTAKRFLQAGYSVVGTVRSLSSPNTELVKRALLPLAAASDSRPAADLKSTSSGDIGRLSIVEIPDITKPGAFNSAVEGVEAIAHLASPVSMNPSSPREMIDASVNGTLELLKSARLQVHHHHHHNNRSPMLLKSIVCMSSISAIYSPKQDRSHVYTEKDWNDAAEKEVDKFGEKTPGYVVYQASKSLAEKKFWEFAEEESGSLEEGGEGGGGGPLKGVGMSALCPAPTIGPPLYLPQPISSLSMRAKDVHDILNGGPVPEFSTIRGTFVDVRDVAELVFRAVERDLSGEELGPGGGGGGGDEVVGRRRHSSQGRRERYLVVGGQRASPRGIVEALLKNGGEKLPEEAKKRMRPLEEAGEPVPESEFARFDAGRARELLGRDWIGFEQSVLDTARVFLEKE